MLTLPHAGPEHADLIERLNAMLDKERMTHREMVKEARRRGWESILAHIATDLGIEGVPSTTYGAATVEFRRRIPVTEEIIRANPGVQGASADIVRRIYVPMPPGDATCRCDDITDRMVMLALWSEGTAVPVDQEVKISNKRCPFHRF